MEGRWRLDAGQQARRLGWTTSSASPRKSSYVKGGTMLRSKYHTVRTAHSRHRPASTQSKYNCSTAVLSRLYLEYHPALFSDMITMYYASTLARAPSQSITGPLVNESI